MLLGCSAYSSAPAQQCESLCFSAALLEKRLTIPRSVLMQVTATFTRALGETDGEWTTKMAAKLTGPKLTSWRLQLCMNFQHGFWPAGMTADCDPTMCVHPDMKGPPIPMTFDEVANKIIFIAAFCSSVTARGFLYGVCLCVSPWWGHFLLQQMTGKQKVLWSLVSMSFVKVLRYCNSEQSKTENNYRHVYLQDMGW